jgi:hypothetical protein
MNDELEKRFEEREDFNEIVRYTVPGYVVGLVAGFILDNFGLQRSPIGQWFVRTFAGAGESIFEGLFSLRKRFSGGEMSMAEAYGCGKFLGMFVV